MNIRCRTNKYKPEWYTYNNPKKDLIVDESLIKKLNFTYFLDENNITLTQKPTLAFHFKLYDMKKLYPAQTYAKKIDEVFINALLNGLYDVEADINMGNYMNSTTYVIDDITVAGRIFYELQLTDTNLNAISFIHYQGQLERFSEFPMKKKLYWIIGVVFGSIIFITLFVILIMKTFRKGKGKIYNYPDTSRLDENDNTKNEINTHQRIPNIQQNVEK